MPLYHRVVQTSFMWVIYMDMDMDMQMDRLDAVMLITRKLAQCRNTSIIVM